MMHSRRDFLRHGTALAAGTALCPWLLAAQEKPGFQFKYLLGSCLYGYKDLEEIVPEVRKTGATALDIWPKVHGNQREQLDEMGHEKFLALLEKHKVTLGCITQYKLGPLNLQPEMKVASQLGCQTIVTGAVGPKGLSGDELKQGVAEFLEKMKPHVAAAEEAGVTVAIENHGNSLIQSPDSLKWLAELNHSDHLKIALAPYHLPQDPQLLAQLVRDLGPAIHVFYAWQHGTGSSTPQPKEKELLQLPGRGELDFRPIVEALVETDFQGWTEIFMHSFPRGTSMLEETAAITAEVNRARAYLEDCLPTV